MDMQIYFPHLGIRLEHVGKTFSVFGFPIAYYGVVIVGGMLLALALVMREAKRSGQDPEMYYNMGLLAILFGIVGARIYYVIFDWDLYKDNLLEIFHIRNGGLAIYGGVIGGVLTVFAYAKWKKISFPLLADTACIGLILGQIVGRWGNFFNREAFGEYTDGLLAMQIPVSAVRRNEITPAMWEHVENIGGVDFIQVSPTFLYESLWNVAVLLVLLVMCRKKAFDGQVFLCYLIGYGLGRLWIEGLRTDQLLLPVVGIPVSQLLSGCLVALSAVLMCLGLSKRRRQKTNAG